MHDEPAFVALGVKSNRRGDGGSESPATPTPSRLCRQGKNGMRARQDERMQEIGKRIKRLKEGNR